jgi:membrane protease YdiL (CAAX protease family)
VSEYVAYFVASLEILFILLGLMLLWRLAWGPLARANRKPPALPPWPAPISEFLVFLCLIMFGAVVAAFVAGGFVERLGLAGNEVTVFSGAAFQLGMLLGIALYHFGFKRTPSPPRPPGPGIFAAGAATFLVSLPLLGFTAMAWEAFLKICGLPAERQDLIEMFENVDSPFLLVTMVVLAIGTAPVSEELVFRAGFFRYFRTRMPYGIALVAPALFFATLHVNWDTLEGLASVGPLIMLAIVFSVAYERTGRIGTSMVAHALFNLNTIMLIFTGTDI